MYSIVHHGNLPQVDHENPTSHNNPELALIQLLLEQLLGQEGRRIMALKDKPNSELFRLYDDDLVLRIHNEKNLRDTRHILSFFQNHLEGAPPSTEAAKSFLVRYAHLKPRTRYRYTQMVQAFMTWYGLPLSDVRVRILKSLPTYIEDSDIEKLLSSFDKK